MLTRRLFSEDHDIFRESVRKFIETEITPFHMDWEHEGIVPRAIWEKAGAQGLLGCSIPEEFGGAGADHLFDFVVVEELARAGITAPGFNIHNDMVMPYINNFGTDEQKLRWLPPMVEGKVIGALGLTEPQAGSDLRDVRTRAVRDGDDFVINGQKVFISNGQLCDIIVLACKTDPNETRGNGGITLFLVEADRPGFKRGRRLEKLGMKGQDTSELFFEDVRVPASNMLGELHGGFKLLMRNLALERLTQAVRSASLVEAVLEWTVDYVRDRKMFDKTLGDMQNTQFKLAELKTDITVGRVMVDRCIEAYQADELDGIDAAMVKMFMSNLHTRVVDECLQFFGGWGYMWEYPIARAYVDARVVRIAGGSIEVMKQIIGRSLFPRDAKAAKA